MSKKIYLCTNNFYTLFGTVSIFASGHTNRGKERKSEDLEYLAVINYEILEYVFWNKANCHIKFSPNG